MVIDMKLNDYFSVPGMLLRYFVNFYDMEIIEEEAFLSWKEDVTQEYPAKGKALFQVIFMYIANKFICLYSFSNCSLTMNGTCVLAKIRLLEYPRYMRVTLI